MHVFVTTDTDLNQSTVVRKLEENRPEFKNKVIVISQDEFSNVLDYMLHSCRDRGAFRRRLLLPPSDLDVMLRLLLKTANKELTGDSSHTRSEFLHLRNEVEKARKLGTWPIEGGESTVDLAAKNYQEFLKKCNLVDIWAVCEDFKKELTEDKDPKCVLVHSDLNGFDAQLLVHVGVQSYRNLVLDSEDLQISEPCQLEDFLKEGTDEPCNLLSNCPGVQILNSVLRLVVNTRDELALARVLTQSGLLTPAQCLIVRQETEKSNLAMYQYLVSYVTQTSLGGKSYAPGEEHPFVEFENHLEDFIKLMERVQTRIEETKDALSALEKVSACVNSWLLKKGIRIQDEDLESWSKQGTRVQKRQQQMEATPGRGLIGKPGIKLITGLVDMLSCVPDPEESEGLTKTPLRSKKLLNFFRTPAAEAAVNAEKAEEDMDEFDRLVDEAGVAEKLGTARTPVTAEPKPAYVRFKSSLAWAQESSPVPDSAGRSGVRVGGSTLVCAAACSPSTPLRHVENVSEILSELREREMKERLEEIAERKKDIEKPKVKSRKRILAKEAEEEAEKKFGVENKKQKVEKEKKPREKKKIATPKGQTKLTSFFTR